jgi:hypothetical protein
MNEHIETPGTDDVEGHFLPLDADGGVDFTPSKVPLADEDDVEGHVLDLDIERKR